MSTPALFAVVVLIWGTTWYAIVFQLNAAAVEVSVALRFALAAAAILGWCVLRRIPLRLSRRQHAWVALQGGLGYSLSYLAVYHAERHVVSGLVAVGYAATPLINLALTRWLFGTPIRRRPAFGGVLGLVGVALVFAPQLGPAALAGATTATGALLTAAAVLLSAAAVMVMIRLGQEGVRGWAPLGLAMGYGALCSLGVAAVLGRSFAVLPSPGFLVSLAYLALAGSALAFGAFYALVDRVGATRAGYVGVAVPVVALLVSTWFEGFRWQPVSLAGVALVLAGNVVMLSPGRAARAPGAEPA